jgi:hypothetical protein
VDDGERARYEDKAKMEERFIRVGLIVIEHRQCEGIE